MNIKRGDGGEGKLFRKIELRAPLEQREAIYKSIMGSSSIDIEYVALLTLASLIALFGLLENSAAVIIGAMLISPLMNPILSAALALLLGDGRLGKRSASVLALSIAGSIGIAWLIAFLIPLKQATPEILARTAPNLLDLFIAFLSGLAGTLALRGGSVAMTILPGVAIAVAVVPPLSVVGYGLSTHQGSIAGGAFLLFVTNLVSIIISAVVVFRVMGFQPRRDVEQGRWKFKYRMGASALLLIALSIPLFLTLRKAAIQIAVHSEVQRELKSAFEKDKASVADINLSQLRNGISIQATLRTARYIQTETIHSVEDTLRMTFGPDTKLLVDQILVTQGGVASPQPTSQNPILGGVVKPVEEKAPFDFKASSLESLDLIQREVASVLAGTGIQEDTPPELDLGTNPLVLRLHLTSSEPLNSQTITVLTSQIESKLGTAIQLHGQVELRNPSLQLKLVNLGFNKEDRAALGRLIDQVQENSLRLQVGCSPGEQEGEGKANPRLFSEIQVLLSKSALKSSQWTMAVNPQEIPDSEPVGDHVTVSSKTEAKESSAIPAGQFQCDLKSFQGF